MIITIPCPIDVPSDNPYPADRWRLSAAQLSRRVVQSRYDQLTKKFGARCVRIDSGRASFEFEREADAVLFRLKYGGEVRKPSPIATTTRERSREELWGGSLSCPPLQDAGE